MKIFDSEITVGEVLIAFFVAIIIFIELVQFVFWYLRLIIEFVK